MNSINFLLESNTTKLYDSIKERIYSQINYNIEKKGKYKGVVDKLLLKISKKDLCVDDLNSLAVDTITPFLISKIQKTTTHTLPLPENMHFERQLPVSSEIVLTPHEVDLSTNTLNLIESFNTIEGTLQNNPDNLESNEPENTLQEDVEDQVLEEPVEDFLTSFGKTDGFDKYDHMDENLVSVKESDANMIDTFENTLINNDISDKTRLLQIELQTLREELHSMSSKIKSEGFTDKFQLYDNTITTKTTLILDISKNEKNTSSIEIFGPHAPGAYGWDPTVAATGGTGTGWGRGYAASTTIGNYFQTQSSNIRDYNITLSDSLYYPPNTEVMLESFTIHKFQGYKRDSTNTTSTPAITGETFSNFIVRIRGGKFENIKKFSNVDLYSEDATIIVPNHPYGSSTITINQPQQHHIDPTQHYVGTLKEGGIIDSLRVDLLGTFIDTEKVVENGFSTWTYLYPWDVDSQCTIRLKLIPPI